MKKIFLLLTLIISGTFLNAVEAKEIPLENFFKDSEFNQIKISPDGKHYAFTFRDDTQVNLAIMRRADKKILGTYEFGKWMQVVNFFWGNDERVLMEVEKYVGRFDNRGSLKTLYAGNIDGKKKAQLIKIQSYWYNIVSMLEDDPKQILITKNYNTEGGKAKPTKLNIYNGRQVKADTVPGIDAQQLLATPKGDVRFGVESEADENNIFVTNYRIAYKKPGSDSWNTLRLAGLEGKEGDTFNPLALSPDGKYAYVSTNVGKKTNSLYQIDLSNGSGKYISGNKNVDLDGLLRTETGEVFGAIYSDGYPTLDFLKTGHPTEALYKSLLSSFPDSRVGITSYTADDKTVVLRVSNDTNPGDFYLFDLNTKKAEYIASTREWIDPKQMAEVKPITYQTRDGLTIHGYLTLPKGSDGKNLPLIVNPHGGPHGPRDNWGFNPEVQFLANRGYAVLQPNFRGSGGYGYEFTKIGYRNWGTTMQDDLTDATNWAIQQGIADPDRICIYGGSYGGYAALMSVTREPDMYKCSLGYVGVYDLKVMKTAGDVPQTEGGRKFLTRVHGNDNAELEKHSPSYNVDKIKAALFIAHGSEDVRVPMEQYYSLKNALDKQGIPFESMVKADGHGYSRPENRVAFYTKMEEFFDKHIGD